MTRSVKGRNSELEKYFPLLTRGPGTGTGQDSPPTTQVPQVLNYPMDQDTNPKENVPEGLSFGLGPFLSEIPSGDPLPLLGMKNRLLVTEPEIVRGGWVTDDHGLYGDPHVNKIRSLGLRSPRVGNKTSVIPRYLIKHLYLRIMDTTRNF